MAVGTAGLIVGSIIGGLTGFLESSEKNKAAKAQAQQLLNNVKILEDEIARGEVNMQEALQRIDTLISTSKGEIKKVMEEQVNLAVKDIKEQYKMGLESAMGEIRTELGQRRLLGSEAGQETRVKTTERLAGQAQRETSRTRERALNEIAAQIADLNLKGGLMKEGERKAYQQFRLGTLGEIMQLKNMAATLKGQQESPILSVLTGAAGGGLGDVLSDLFAPTEKQGETGKGEMKLPGEV